MRIIFLLAIAIAYSFSGLAQINLSDSTVQVINYWDKKEKQTYHITTYKYKIKDADTTTREIMHYDVDVTVKDSTAKSYTIEWFYKNYRVESDNEITKKLMAASEAIKVVFKTDELGAFVEVVNWQEVRDMIKGSLKKLANESSSIPNFKEAMQQVEGLFSSKQSIESVAIRDIHQFHTFHGAKYKLAEVLEGTMKAPNLYESNNPFDSEFQVYLDEIDAEENNYVMRSLEAINKEQLKTATINYLTNLAKKMGAPAPNFDEVKDLSNEIITASRIHNTGWVIYSIQTKTVSSGNHTNIEERIIELQ
jgi:hypothetical protein